MIGLNVTLDPALVRELLESGWAGLRAAWTNFCQRHLLLDLGAVEDFFDCDRTLSASEWSHLEETASYIDSNLQQSIQHITRWLPEVKDPITQDVTVVFLPCGKYTFSPRLGLQLFSLDPQATHLETYLFLVHVYYHELSFLNETPKGRRCSSEQLSAEDFKEWVRLLIRNEGIGNYAVLEKLLEVRDSRPDYVFRYFTYARKIGNPTLLENAVSILSSAFTEVNDENFSHS